MIKTYRKLSVETKAVQYTGENADEILKFMFPDIEPDAEASLETIQTLKEDMKVSKGDWIIQGVNGDFSSCKPDIFLKTYEEV